MFEESVGVLDFSGDKEFGVCVVAFVAGYACMAADTWASEVGILSTIPPRHILTLRPCLPGTNGGVSMLGFLASAFGGGVVGLCFAIPSLIDFSLNRPYWRISDVSYSQFLWIPIGVFAGLVGSLIDSILGALFQFSGFDERTKTVVNEPGKQVKHISGWNILSNNQVNVTALVMTSGLTTFLVGKLLW